MKKLLILMLVLGITSVANAAFTLVVNGEDIGDAMDLLQSTTIDIGIHNDTAGNAQIGTMQFYGFVIINQVAGGEWTGPSNVFIPPAVTGSFNTDYGVGDWLGTGDVDVYEATLSNGVPTDYSGVGVLGDYEYHCLQDGIVVLVELMNGTSGMIEDNLTITQVPEPMTIALLGLGGLFLLRRRK